jgi:hypothetical protein
MRVDDKTMQLLQEACQAKVPVLFSGDGLNITFQTHILKVDSVRVMLENRVPPRFIRAVANSKNFSLQARMVRFQSERIETDGEHLIFPLGENSLIEETRQSERFSFAAEERVIVEILNPYDGETRLSKAVMDMSATGMSLSTTFESQLFKPDTVLPSLRVMIDGELYTQARGRVVYNRKLLDLSGQLRTQVGVKFEGQAS